MSSPDGLPGDPADQRLLIQALADGELDAATVLALERRMESDRALASEYAAILALQSAVHRLPRATPSAALQARLVALGAGETTAADPVIRLSPRPRRAFDWRAIAASIVVSATLASVATYWLAGGTPTDDFTDAIASSHRRALLAASPIDIASSDRHTVKPWLDAKVGLSPPANDFAAEGFPLVGGRIEVIGGRPVPALAYRHNEHLITLIAVPRPFGSATDVDIKDLSADGFSMVRWTDDAFAYWALSDLNRAELDAFARLFRDRATAG